MCPIKDTFSKRKFKAGVIQLRCCIKKFMLAEIILNGTILHRKIITAMNFLDIAQPPF